MRINEARSVKDDKRLLGLIASGDMGDAFFHVLEQDDPRMDGFTQTTGFKYHTIPLAADKALLKPDYDSRFNADVSYVGSALPEKREFFKNYVYPLNKEYDLRIYGQDWTKWDRALSWVQRGGQYFNIKPLAKIRKPKLALEDEARIYASSVVSINVHEEYQRKYGGDCNERTFKIPLCGGFEVVDNVACIKHYFVSGKELIIAENPGEWVEMVRHYLKYPEERQPIIESGKQRVLRDHTYHNRAEQMIAIKNGSFA
jgi:spore maturation protein CgeB